MAILSPITQLLNKFGNSNGIPGISLRLGSFKDIQIFLLNYKIPIPVSEFESLTLNITQQKNKYYSQNVNPIGVEYGSKNIEGTMTMYNELATSLKLINNSKTLIDVPRFDILFTINIKNILNNSIGGINNSIVNSLNAEEITNVIGQSFLSDATNALFTSTFKITDIEFTSENLNTKLDEVNMVDVSFIASGIN